jgi:hypothetical protein
MTGQRKAQPKSRKSATKPDGARAIPYSKVKRETVEWFWDGLVPYGMLALLAGDPGLGKSLLTIRLAAKASQEGISSILLSAEDHKGATIRPRLEAAKADLKLVHHVEVRREGIEEGLRLPNDGVTLDGLVKETKARLVVVDPFAAHLPESINSWSDQSVRLAMAPLQRTAERHGCAVVIVAHLNKGGGQNPLHRTGGSIGIPGAVRSALLLARDPDDPAGERGRQRILAHIKCNVGPISLSRACEVKESTSSGKTAAPTLEVKGPSLLSGWELLETGQEKGSPRQEAEGFLLELLAEGSLRSADLKAAAKRAGHSWRTIERAKNAVGVKKVGPPGVSVVRKAPDLT